jgi:hypothetical protein
VSADLLGSQLTQMVFEHSRSANVLLHIGYHKTGSTFLQRQVFDAGDLGFVRLSGERRLINQHLIATNSFHEVPAEIVGQIRDEAAAAASAGRILVVSHERLSGYPALGGYDSRLIADRLHGMVPGARVLIVIREQKSFIRSMYSQYVTDGGDQSLSRFLNPPEPHLNRVPGWDFAFLAYHRLIGYYRDLFGAERVVVLPFELLTREPQRFVAGILRFCGRGPENAPPPSATVLNPKRPLTLQFFARLLNRHLVRSQLSNSGFLPHPTSRAALARLAPLVGALSPGFVERALDCRMRRAIDAAVGDRYAESNRLTRALTGLDLAAYGYDCGGPSD